VSGREPLALLAVGALALVVSGIGPNDRATWMLEVAPAVIAAPVLIATARRLPLTPLAYRLIFVHALILMVGGHYTYAKVPAGFWVQDALDLARNPYDRLGHLAQGFVPAIVVREILVRRSPLQPGKWLTFLVLCVCLAISAAYELVECGVAVIGGESADAFLGTQGDQWDTQWDMLMALVGAALSLLLLREIHDRQIATLEGATRG
jgi:putative membrane protein